MCGSDTYYVHKAIICPQSDWFTAACRPDTFKEGKTNIIDIPASAGRDDSTNPLIHSDDFDWDLDVETTTSVKRMIHYFYHHDYLEQWRSLSYWWRTGLFAEHSRMYAMGDKYGIPGLKAVALAKLCDLDDLAFSANMVRAAPVIAFNSTPDSDQPLREAIVELIDVFHQAPIIRNNKLLQKAISTIPELAYSLYCKSWEPQDLRYRASDVSSRDGSQGRLEEATVGFAMALGKGIVYCESQHTQR